MRITLLLLGICMLLESVNVIICEYRMTKTEEEFRYRLDTLEDRVRRLDRMSDDGR